MKTCTSYRHLLALYQTAELNPEERQVLDLHLQVCPDCRQALTELEIVKQTLTGVPAFVPDDRLLTSLRERLSDRLRRQQVKTGFVWPRWTPAVQWGLALLILALGFGLGRWSAEQRLSEAGALETLLTAGQPIRTGQIEIDPYLGEIERIRYHAKSGTVDLRYQTVNHIVFQGPVESPLVRQMIRHALTEEEDPSTRLYAAKVLQAIAQKEQSLDVELIGSLEQVLKKEPNPGVRLMAVRALQSVPINEAIRTALTRVLLYDRNPALRIQAFDSLTGPLEPVETREPLLRSVQADTSSYIRHRANDLLKKIEVEKSTGLLSSREG